MSSASVKNCSNTGSAVCRCQQKREVSKGGDYLSKASRELLGQHVMILQNLLKAIAQKNSDEEKVLKKKAFQNAEDLGDIINNSPAGIGKSKLGEKFVGLFKEHIEGGGNALKAVMSGDQDKIKTAIRKVFDNSADVSHEISSFNPDKLPYDDVKKHFDQHNEYELEIGKAYYQDDAQKASDLGEKNYAMMMKFADMLANGLDSQSERYTGGYRSMYKQQKDEYLQLKQYQ
jgi:hypothetical protein